VQRALRNINEYNVPHYVQNGVVHFQGSVPDKGAIDTLITVTRMVDGVRDVKSSVQVGGKQNF